MSIFVPTRAFDGARLLDALLRFGRRPDAPRRPVSAWARDAEGRLTRRWTLGGGDQA